MLVQWTAVTVLTFFVEEKWQFWVVAILAGTGLGAIQAASRTFMATLIPPGREAEFFGFYALVGKTGAMSGPRSSVRYRARPAAISGRPSPSLGSSSWSGWPCSGACGPAGRRPDAAARQLPG